MILAERLSLLALDPEKGGERPGLDGERLIEAIAPLMIADLLFANSLRNTGERLELMEAMPLAHPLLDEAAHRLARAGRALGVSAALALLRREAPGWQRRMRRSLAARDILEVQVPFPFVRRYRLRSRQAWNESATMLLSLVGDSDSGSADHDPAFALLLAVHHCGLLGDVVDAGSARSLRTRIQPQLVARDGKHSRRDTLQLLFSPT
jgi:hypothetical protein